MKLTQALALVGVVGAAAFAIFPGESAGFSVLGTSLNANAIGFQVNPTSFTDANANNNTAADANFPGAAGAAMAVWKAACEWNSELRAGTGAGDPAQPGGLGSGASNFDFMYHGVVTSGGGGSSAVVRASTTTLGAGVYAATGSSNSGWNMTFDDSATNNWNWQDGPGNETSNSQNKVDIEGICVHELGHSLGLGHTTTNGATMFPSTSQSGSYNQRSIEADDIAGVQSIYGVKSATKPKITGISGTLQQGSSITITGANFSASGNEVWFTKKTNGTTTGSPMTPTKVTGLASSNGGTTIVVTIPANTAAGDIIVHKSGLTSDQSLKSAPFPYAYNGTGGPTNPVLTSLSPPSISIMSLPTPVLTINGANLTAATGVTIGTRFYGPGAFSVVNDGVISVTFNPPPDQAGPAVPVFITTSSGNTNILTENISLPAGHQLLISDSTPAPGSLITIYLGEPAQGITPLLSHAGCFGGVDVSPYFISNIGGCGDWGFVSPLPAATDASGVSSYSIQLPAGWTGSRYFQSFGIDLSNPVFPLTGTNVALISVF